MAELVLGVFRSASPPPEEELDLVDIGTAWIIAGDSQTEGRVPGDGPCDNPGSALRHAINENEDAGVSSFTNLGLGGSTLNETNGRYMNSGARTDATWVHTQESGNQAGDNGSQDTAAKFKAVLKGHFIDVDTESPNAAQSYEYPHSFGRQGDVGRNWDDEYEDALEEAVAEVLSENGITVYVAKTRQIVEALETYNSGGITFTSDDLWYDDEEPDAELYAHYTAFGNAAVAFAMLLALGRDPRDWTFASWTDITADQITALKDVAGRVINGEI